MPQNKVKHPDRTVQVIIQAMDLVIEKKKLLTFSNPDITTVRKQKDGTVEPSLRLRIEK